MAPSLRHLIGLAAVGAGLIHLALVSGADPMAGLVLAVIGIAEFGWGVLVLFDERFLRLRVVSMAALIPLTVWVGLLLAHASPPAYPLATSSVLELFVAIVSAVQVRWPGSAGSVRRRGVVVVVLAGLVIALLVGVALFDAAGEHVTDDLVWYPHAH